MNEKSTKIVFQKITKKLFNTKNLRLNLEVDLNFLLQIINASVVLSTAVNNNKNFRPMRINQFIMNSKRKLVVIFTIVLKSSLFSLIFLKMLIFSVLLNKLRKIFDNE